MCLWQIRSNRQCAFDIRLYLFQLCGTQAVAKPMPLQTAVSESCIRKREIRILCQRLAIKSCGAVVYFPFVCTLRLAFLVFTLQKQIISFGIARGRCGQGVRLARRKLCLKLGGNCFGNIALDRKYVIKWLVVTLYPQMCVSSCVD